MHVQEYSEHEAAPEKPAEQPAEQQPKPSEVPEPEVPAEQPAKLQPQPSKAPSPAPPIAPKAQLSIKEKMAMKRQETLDKQAAALKPHPPPSKTPSVKVTAQDCLHTNEHQKAQKLYKKTFAYANP